MECIKYEFYKYIITNYIMTNYNDHQEFMFLNYMQRHYRYKEEDINGIKIPNSNAFLRFNKPKNEIESIKCLEKYLSKPIDKKLYFILFKCDLPEKYLSYKIHEVIIKDYYILESILINEKGIIELFLTN